MREGLRPAAVDWGRAIERLCFLFPPVIGVGIVGLVQEADPGVPFLERGLLIVGTFGYTVLSVALGVAILVDARRVGTTRQWEPTPWANGLAAVALGPFAGVVYLFRRHRRFGTRAGWSGWWLVVALSLATTLAGAVAAVIGVVLAVPGLATTGVGLAGTIAFGAFPIAIHRDAAYVTTVGGSWRPNPGLYLGLAFLSLSVPPLQPVVAGYYLARRRRDVGTP